MNGQKVVKFVLVVALVIGVIGYVASAVAQTAPSTRTAITKPPPFTKPDRPNAQLKPPAAKAGTAAVTYSYRYVSGQALRPKYSPVQYDYWGFGGGAIYATDATYVNEPFCTQIYLPQGAKIYGMQMSFYRLDTTFNCVGYLTVYDNFGSPVVQYPINTGTWTGYNYGDVTWLDHTVDNNNFTYLMEWVPANASFNMSLCSFIIGLEDSPVPTTTKSAVIPLY